MSFPVAPALGDTHTLNDKTFKWDGSAWLQVVDADHPLANSRVGIQKLDVYTIPGTYEWNKPSYGTLLWIRVWGAGGGGSNSTDDRAGGGGGGSFMERFMPLTEVTASIVLVTVGAGGAVNMNGGNSKAVHAFGGGTYAEAAGGDAGMSFMGGYGVGPTSRIKLAGPLNSTPTVDVPRHATDIWGGGPGGGGPVDANDPTGRPRANDGGNAWMGGGGGAPRRNDVQRFAGASMGHTINPSDPDYLTLGGRGGSREQAGTAPAGGGGWNAAGAPGRVEMIVL